MRRGTRFAQQSSETPSRTLVPKLLPSITGVVVIRSETPRFLSSSTFSEVVVFVKIFSITEGMKMNTKFFMRRLSQISYERNDIELRPGNFRSRGFKVDVFPPHAQGIISVVFDDDVIESIYESDPLTGEECFLIIPTHFSLRSTLLLGATN